MKARGSPWLQLPPNQVAWLVKADSLDKRVQCFLADSQHPSPSPFAFSKSSTFPVGLVKAVLSFGPILLLIFNTSYGFHRPRACFHRWPFNYTLLAGSFMKASLEIDLRTMELWLLGERNMTGTWYFRHCFPSFLRLFFLLGNDLHSQSL